MATESVVVRPGMFPATRIVAPNSPMARANASTMPPVIPRTARGRVMVRKTRHSLAPSVRAICSVRTFTSSNATRQPRTRNGNDITIMAMTTAFQVKTTSMPARSRRRPRACRRPRILRSSRPVATGGITSMTREGNQYSITLNHGEYSYYVPLRGDAKGEADDPPVVTGHRTVVLTRKPYLRKISCAAGDWR